MEFEREPGATASGFSVPGCVGVGETACAHAETGLAQPAFEAPMLVDLNLQEVKAGAASATPHNTRNRVDRTQHCRKLELQFHDGAVRNEFQPLDRDSRLRNINDGGVVEALAVVTVSQRRWAGR